MELYLYFIDWYELYFLKAQEIRGYLKSFGADIKEESTTPLHEDLEQLLAACDVSFKNETGLFACSLQLYCQC